MPSHLGKLFGRFCFGKRDLGDGRCMYKNLWLCHWHSLTWTWYQAQWVSIPNVFSYNPWLLGYKRICPKYAPLLSVSSQVAGQMVQSIAIASMPTYSTADSCWKVCIGAVTSYLVCWMKYTISILIFMVWLMVQTAREPELDCWELNPWSGPKFGTWSEPNQGSSSRFWKFCSELDWTRLWQL